MKMKKNKQVYIYSCKRFKIRETLEKDTKIWYKWFNDPKITKFFENSFLFESVVEYLT